MYVHSMHLRLSGGCGDRWWVGSVCESGRSLSQYWSWGVRGCWRYGWFGSVGGVGENLTVSVTRNFTYIRGSENRDFGASERSSLG